MHTPVVVTQYIMILSALVNGVAAVASLASVAAAAPPSYGHQEPAFYKGFDLSSLKIEENGGYIYKDTARGNQTRPVEDILGDAGMNIVRLRLWVYPKVPFDDGYYETYDLNYTISLAKRFSKKGYKIYLDYRKPTTKTIVVLR